MKKLLFGSIIVLLLLILILPVTAQEEPIVTVTKSCPSTACVGKAFTCTISASYAGPSGVHVYVQDRYPHSMNNIIPSSGGTNYPDPNWLVEWSFPEVPAVWSKSDITITMTPTTTGDMGNTLTGWVLYDLDWYRSTDAYFTTTVAECGKNTPEFPSAFLPAVMIIGFLGAVLLIQRTRKQ